MDQGRRDFGGAMTRVVILNGVSSSGKSSIARALQRLAPIDFAYLAIDDFMSMLPPGRETNPEWFRVERSEDRDGPLVAITNGPRGAKLLGLMRQLVRSLADSEIDVLVDDVCTANEIIDYRALLAGHQCLFIKVHVDTATVAAREINRGDRMIGLAREQAGRIHKGISYDLVVHNSNGQAENCATEILDALGIDRR
jgi:chloramphenicol 3-O phosphotransferase